MEIYEMESEDMLRLLAKFYPVYQILWYGPVTLTQVKQSLMEDYGFAESTARSYINTIGEQLAPPLYVDEGIVYLDEYQVQEIEDRLERAFGWDKFDTRHDEYESMREKKFKLDSICEALTQERDLAYAEHKKDNLKNKEKIESLEAELNEARAELLPLKQRLCEINHWKLKDFMLYRIKIRLFGYEETEQKEGL